MGNKMECDICGEEIYPYEDIIIDDDDNIICLVCSQKTTKSKTEKA